MSEDESVIQETPLSETIDNAPQMKGQKPVALIIVILCIVLVIAVGAISALLQNGARVYGELEWKGKRLTVDQKLEGLILVKIQNNTSEKMNFGWVDQGSVILHTTKGTYIQKIKRTVPSRSSGNICLVYHGAKGVPQSITFESVGSGLGADYTIQMDLSVQGEGNNSIRSMNLFESAWAYVRWAFFWLIAGSDTQGIILRIFISVMAVAGLAYLFSLLMPRKAIRAKVVRKYIRKTEHYQNGMHTGTTKTYYVVFETENGKRKKVNVLFRSNYDMITSAGWGLLTMKGIIFRSFEYLPYAGRVVRPVITASDEESSSDETSSSSETPAVAKKKHIALIVMALLAVAVIGYLFVKPDTVQSIYNLITGKSGQAAVESTSTPLVSDTAQPKENAENTPLTMMKAEQPNPQKNSADADKEKTESGLAQQQFRVNRDKGLTLRKKADTKSGMVTKVENNDIVTAVDDNIVMAGNNHWRQVKTQSGETGWIISDFLVEISSGNGDGETEDPQPVHEYAQEGTGSYAGITFTVKKTDSSSGTLVIDSKASDIWKFAPWVGLSGTVTLVQSDKTKSNAEINLSNMLSEYGTMNFDKGKSFSFELFFDKASGADWKKVTFSIASFMKTHEVKINMK